MVHGIPTAIDAQDGTADPFHNGGVRRPVGGSASGRRLAPPPFESVQTAGTPADVLRAAEKFDLDAVALERFRRDADETGAVTAPIRSRQQRLIDQITQLCLELDRRQNTPYAAGRLAQVPLETRALQAAAIHFEARLRRAGLPHIFPVVLPGTRPDPPPPLRRLQDLFCHPPEHKAADADEPSLLQRAYGVHALPFTAPADPSQPLGTTPAVVRPRGGIVARLLPEPDPERDLDEHLKNATSYVAGYLPDQIADIPPHLRATRLAPALGHGLVQTRRLVDAVRTAIRRQYRLALRDLYEAGFVALGARNLESLLWYLGQPATKYKVVLVAQSRAGVATRIASGLSACGYKTGLLTSLLFYSVRERICVDGKPIDRSSFSTLLRSTKRAAAALGFCPSVLDYVAAVGLSHFTHAACDFVVIQLPSVCRELGLPLLPSMCCAVVVDAVRPDDAVFRLGHRTLLVLGPRVPKSFSDGVSAQRHVCRVTPAVGNEAFPEEEDREIAVAALTAMNLPLRAQIHQGVNDALVRFHCEVLPHGALQSAGRHVHRFMQAAYAAARKIHTDWASLAKKRPELFVHLLQEEAAAPPRVVPTPWDTEYIGRLTSMDKQKREIQTPRRRPPAVLVVSRFLSLPSGRETSEPQLLRESSEVGRPSATVPSRLLVADDASPSTMDSVQEGASLFLEWGVKQTTGWPKSYIERMPFENWVSQYRAWMVEERQTQSRRVAREQLWRRRRLKELTEATQALNNQSSALHFTPFQKEEYFWSFAEIAALRVCVTTVPMVSQTESWLRTNPPVRHVLQ